MLVGSEPATAPEQTEQDVRLTNVLPYQRNVRELSRHLTQALSSCTVPTCTVLLLCSRSHKKKQKNNIVTVPFSMFATQNPLTLWPSAPVPASSLSHCMPLATLFFCDQYSSRPHELPPAEHRPEQRTSRTRRLRCRVLGAGLVGPNHFGIKGIRHR